ncbi:hypothetical protein NTGBS_100042 [Candidatus Nitrotoga sp. BS]|nr:hypothetical protein NTGBS_100042 [Candidatus Nitrotoga sp. BS]
MAGVPNDVVRVANKLLIQLQISAAQNPLGDLQSDEFSPK